MRASRTSSARPWDEANTLIHDDEETLDRHPFHIEVDEGSKTDVRLAGALPAAFQRISASRTNTVSPTRPSTGMRGEVVAIRQAVGVEPIFRVQLCTCGEGCIIKSHVLVNVSIRIKTEWGNGKCQTVLLTKSIGDTAADVGCWIRTEVVGQRDLRPYVTGTRTYRKRERRPPPRGRRRTLRERLMGIQ